MKNLAFRGVAIFFILVVATTLMMDVMKMDFGTVNYWDRHGIFFLIFISLFPRLTLVFSSVVTGGFLWWLGFIFCPRILVALLATVTYFHTNPVLVSFSWLIALSGEVFEKWGIGKGRLQVRTFGPNRWASGPKATYGDPEERRSPTSLGSDDVIEAEFTKKG